MAPMQNEIWQLGAGELARLIARRKASPVDALQATLDRIQRLNPRYNAFLSLSPRAVDDARSAERRVARGHRAPLLGVPVAIKDLILSQDAPTTAGSRVFGEGMTSDHDAPVVAALRRAGAVIVGRTNLHELALGVTNENEHFDPVHNPWDLERIPGGSSGGSAAAVAAGLVPVALGTDTRGSIRIPAAACGITGLKPTRGRVSTEDVIPLSWSLDSVGPMTRSAEDAALVFGVIAGRAGRTSWNMKGLQIGLSEFLMRDMDTEITACVEDALKVFARAGAKVREVRIPELEGHPDAAGLLTLAEAIAFYHPHIEANPQGVGPRVLERLKRAYQVTARDLVLAQRKRLEVIAAIERTFETFKVLAGATIPAFPGVIGSGEVRIGNKASPVLSEFPRLTSLANFADLPALSIPCGFGKAGMPVGLQLVGPGGSDEALLGLGAFFQKKTDWHRRWPPSATEG